MKYLTVLTALLMSGCTVLEQHIETSWVSEQTLKNIAEYGVSTNKHQYRINKETGETNYFLDVYKDCENDSFTKTWSRQCVLDKNADIREERRAAERVRLAEEKRKKEEEQAKREQAAKAREERRQAEIEKYGPALWNPLLDLANAITCGSSGDLSAEIADRVIEKRRDQVNWYLVEEIHRQGHYDIRALRVTGACQRIANHYK